MKRSEAHALPLTVRQCAEATATACLLLKRLQCVNQEEAQVIAGIVGSCTYAYALGYTSVFLDDNQLMFKTPEGDIILLPEGLERIDAFRAALVEDVPDREVNK